MMDTDDIIFYFSIILSLFLIAEILGPCERIIAPKLREYWTHPLNMRRDNAGIYNTLIEELRTYPDRYKTFLRMTAEQFDELLRLVGPQIEKQNTNMRRSIPPEVRLAITLYYMANGVTYFNIGTLFRVGESTARGIVKEVSEVIFSVLSEIYMPLPSSPTEWRRIANRFNEKWNYPNCIGSLDGKHVRIMQPNDAGSEYWNYKGFNSIVLMALVDADYKFVMIDVGQLGGVSDGGIWRDCYFNELLTAGELDLPPPAALPGDTVNCPYHIVADDAFPLKDYLMKPYSRRAMEREKRIFNYRLSRARRVVENAFGILTVRFRCLLTTMSMKPETVSQVVAACCVLHNFLMENDDRRYCPRGYADTPMHNGEIVDGQLRADADQDLTPLQPFSFRRPRHTANHLRNTLTTYFSSTGATEFQDAMIDRR